VYADGRPGTSARMITIRRFLLPLLLTATGALAAFAISACGEDEETTASADEEVQVRITDAAVDPARVEVEPGTIRFVVDNDGQNTHELAIETPDGVERSGAIEPGSSGSVTVELNEGEYPMYDPRENYRAQGLAGVVVVSAERATVTQEETVIEEGQDTVIEQEPETVTEEQERTVTEQETVTQEPDQGGQTSP
jgi:plastocyanin